MWTGLLIAVRDALDEARQHFPGGWARLRFHDNWRLICCASAGANPAAYRSRRTRCRSVLSRRHLDHRRFGPKGDTVKMGCCRRGRTAAQARAIHPHLSRLFFRHQGVPPLSVTSRAITEPLTPAVNKLIEQDRRSIKLRLGPMLGCKQFRRAATSGQECLSSFTRREQMNGVFRRCPQSVPSAQALRNPLFRRGSRRKRGCSRQISGSKRHRNLGIGF
jgi:hypothetical protein